jgi:SET domain-containing protein
MKKKNKKNFIYNIEKPEYYHNSSFNLNILKSLIENAGYGVFTQDKIPNNTFIDRYFAINDNIGIDAFLYPRCYMAMINDAKGSIFSNNCDFKIDEKELIIEVWSIRDIKDGEELLINYGSEYWIW